MSLTCYQLMRSSSPSTTFSRRASSTFAESGQPFGFRSKRHQTCSLSCAVSLAMLTTLQWNESQILSPRKLASGAHCRSSLVVPRWVSESLSEPCSPWSEPSRSCFVFWSCCYCKWKERQKWKSATFDLELPYIDDFSGAVTDDAVDVVAVPAVVPFAVVVAGTACPVPGIKSF